MRITMKKSAHTDQPTGGRWLDVDEVRLVSDLRIMHAKVDELYHIIANLKRRNSASEIHKYADHPVLNEDIARVDEIYQWFVSLKDLPAKKASGGR
jgi:hypothetical protein